MRISIKRGRIIDPASNLDRVTDLHLDKGKIIAAGKAPAGFKPDRIIDASNHYVCPGLVDLAVRLREPGLEHKATIASETRAAAGAGVTSLCCPPDTTPVIDTSAVTELIHQRTLLGKKAKVYCLGALTQGLKGESLANMNALKSAGCVGVSNAYEPITDTVVLRRALEYAATFGLTVHLYCEDNFLRDEGVIHEGMISARLGLAGIPWSAETVAVSRVLLLIEQTGARVHFARLSSARSIDMLARAKQQGLPVTADVGITHLHLTEIDVDGFNSQCHVRPPLRTTQDRKALRRAVAGGTIDAICSDHQPHDEDAKSAPFALTEPGASTIDVLLPLVLQLVRDQILDLQTAIAALTVKPANIAGINAGTLAVGAAADVCIIDPDKTWIPEKSCLISAGKNNPFVGREIAGKVTHTLLDGKLVYRDKN